MRLYWKQKWIDTLLCTAVTLSLVPTICSGFVLTDRWSQSLPVIALCSVVLQAALTLLSRRRRTVWIGSIAGAVLAAAVFAVMRLTSPLSGADAHSTFLFVLVQVVTALLVFLLSLSRPGIAALFVLGNLICAGCHFLQYPAPAWCFFLFLAAVAVLFLHRVGTLSAARAELGGIRPLKYLRQSLLLCAGGFAAALAVYFALVVPLNPPTQELRLITELRSMELMQVLGVSSTEIVLDPDMTSDAPPEETELGDESGEDASDALDGQDEDRFSEMPDLSDLREDLSSTLQQAASAIRYDSFAPNWLWLLLLIPLAVAGAYVLRYVGKKRWRNQVRALSHEDAVVNYYRFFLSRLGRMGLKKLPACTLHEFAENTAVQTQPFEAGGVPFAKLTAIYEKVFYGRCPVSEEEYRCFEDFYDRFYRCLRKETGAVKYYLTAFRY